MQFSIDSRKYSGRFVKRINVTTNDPQNPRTQLMCVGVVKVPLKLMPRTVSFPRINRDSPAVSKTIQITRGDGGPIKPEIVPPADKHVQATLREVEPGEEYELEVKLVPPWPARSLRSSLTIKTGVKEAPIDTVRIYASVAPRLAAIPSRFMIPAKLKKDRDLRVRLKWSGGKPGKILSAKPSDPKLSAQLVEEHGQPVVVLHVPKDYAASPRGRGFVTIKTDDKTIPVLRVPFYALRSRRFTRPNAMPGHRIIRPGATSQPVGAVRPRPATVGKAGLRRTTVKSAKTPHPAEKDGSKTPPTGQAGAGASGGGKTPK